jgi:hypothetical protein
MKAEIKYIELKTGYSDNGPAWIGRVEFSKSGQTVYFNGQAFKGNGHGYCFDIETKKSYWITGIKKRGQNRHWAGKGKIMIDRLVVDDYLKLINSPNLDFNTFELIDIKATDKQRFTSIENGGLDTITIPDKFPDLKDLSIDELKNAIEYLKRKESYTNPNNGQKFITVKKLEAEKLLEDIQQSR